MATRYRMMDVKFDRGLNLDENPASLIGGDLLVAENVWYSGSRIGTRPGVRYEASGFTGRIVGNHPIVGGYEYRRDNDATRTMLAMVSNTLATGSGTFVGFTGVTTSVGAEKVWTFAQHAGVMYAAGGTGTDQPWTWNGTGNATLLTINDLTPAGISPTYIFSKWNRLFAAGFRVSSTGALSTDLSSNPMIVRYSALNQPTVWPAGNTFGGESAIGAFGSFGDEYITGFADFTDNEGDWLLVLTNRTIYEILQLPDVHTPFYVSSRGKAPLGCVHQRAFVSLGLDSGEAVYLSEFGIHSLRQSQEHGGREDRFLSWKIRPLFAGLNRSMIRRAVGAYWRTQGVVVFAVATGSSTVNDTLLVLDVKDTRNGLTADSARWTIWKLSGSTADIRGVNALWPGRTADDKWVLYGGNGFGDVFYFDAATASDLGAGFSIRLRTMDSDHGAPAGTKVLGDAYIHVQPSGDYTPRVKAVFDFGAKSTRDFKLTMAPREGAEWDVSTWDEDNWSRVSSAGRNKNYTFGHYNTIGWQLEHGAADQPVYLVRLAHEAAGLGEDLGDAQGAV